MTDANNGARVTRETNSVSDSATRKLERGGGSLGLTSFGIQIPIWSFGRRNPTTPAARKQPHNPRGSGSPGIRFDPGHFRSTLHPDDLASPSDQEAEDKP